MIVEVPSFVSGSSMTGVCMTFALGFTPLFFRFPPSSICAGLFTAALAAIASSPVTGTGSIESGVEDRSTVGRRLALRHHNLACLQFCILGVRRWVELPEACHTGFFAHS